MLEFENPIQEKKLTSTSLVQEINKEYTLKGSMIKRPGLILFGIDPYEMTAEEVKIIHKNTVSFSDVTKKGNYENPFVRYGKPRPKIKQDGLNRAEFDPHLIYIYALNKENALRKVRKTMDKLKK